ncbi:MAG: hypothetical protein E2O77_00660 [Caldithrix sp.]|nr:MAG: hypothetical protein E2O77_00660 [Caldithrix sp.]
MKRTYFILFAILVFFSNLNINSSYGSDSYKLKYKMAKGTVLYYRLDSQMESLQEMMGSEVEANSKSNANVKITSEGENKDGNLTFLMVYESMLFEMISSMMDSTFKDPEGLIGKRVRKTITPYGDQIKSVELDSIKLGLLAHSGDLASAREFLPNLPDSELKMGEKVSMTDVDSLDMLGGTTVTKAEMEFTLTGKETKLGYDCLKIDVKGTINLEGDGMMQGMKIFIEGDGDFQRTLYFAPKEGLLVAAHNQTDIEMTLALTGQMQMTIPITQSQTSNMTLIKWVESK